MASTYLTETTLGTATDATKFTYSAWVKRSFVPSGGGTEYELLMGSRPSHQDSSGGVWLWQNGEFAFYDYPSAGGSALTTRTSAKLRDVNAWYHLVVVGDASQSGTDKLKFYINGELQTEFAEDNRSSFATIAHTIHDANHPVFIGGRDYSVHYYFNGYMSHIHFIDGTAYPASTFGSTDATTGEWKINTSPSVTYGNNGFFILKDGNSVTDQSGNNNNFTVGGGTLTKSEDCPSNVFATMNPVDSYWMSTTYTNGNNKAVTQGSHRTSMAATLGASSGKFYYEVKFDAETSSAGLVVGIDTKGASSCSVFNGSYCDEYTGRRTYGYGYYSSDGVVYNSGSNVGSYTSFSTGTIICVAVDLDNNKLYFRRNDNAWENSGDPTSGSTGTGAISITAASSTDTGFYFPALSDGSNSGTATFSTNFGNGYFGTTAVSSAGTNASNIGIFEYDVPTGYTAWSTKGLNL